MSSPSSADTTKVRDTEKLRSAVLVGDDFVELEGLGQGAEVKALALAGAAFHDRFRIGARHLRLAGRRDTMPHREEHEPRKCDHEHGDREPRGLLPTHGVI